MKKEFDCRDCGACCIFSRCFELEDLTPESTNAYLQMNYRLNPDGSIESDEVCRKYREGKGCLVYSESWRRDSPCDKLEKGGLECRQFRTMAGLRGL